MAAVSTAAELVIINPTMKWYRWTIANPFAASRTAQRTSIPSKPVSNIVTTGFTSYALGFVENKIRPSVPNSIGNMKTVDRSTGTSDQPTTP